MSEIVSRIELITPDRARELLKNNSHNRPLMSANVATLVNSIKKGEWKMNGDSIRIDKNGNILDGQHRLTAIVRTGMSCQSFVIYGLEPDVFDTIDQGAVRTLSAILSIEGNKHCTVAASVVPMLVANDWGNNPKSVSVRSYNYSKKEFSAFYKEHKEAIDRAVIFTVKNKDNTKFIKPSLLTYLNIIFYRKSPDDCNEFMETFCSGLSDNKKNPAFALRAKLINEALSRKTSGAIGSEYSLAYAIYAWNAFRQDRTVTVLRYNHEVNEFPKPI